MSICINSLENIVDTKTVYNECRLLINKSKNKNDLAIQQLFPSPKFYIWFVQKGEKGL